MPIEVHPATPEELKRLGTAKWPVWECPPSTFDWSYDEPETCHILAGEATVTGDGQSVTFRTGDLVVFPRGLKCVWKVTQAIRKHYRFG